MPCRNRLICKIPQTQYPRRRSQKGNRHAKPNQLSDLRPTNRGGRNITPELLKQYFGTPDRDFKLSSSSNPGKHERYFAQYGAHSPDSSDIGYFTVILTKSYDKDYDLGEYASVELFY